MSDVAQRSKPRYRLSNTEKDPASFGQQECRGVCKRGQKIEMNNNEKVQP